MAVLALVIVVPIIDDEPRVDPYLNFLTAHLDVLPTEPAAVSSDAKFSRSIAKITDLDHVDPALDACAGPVAVYLGARPSHARRRARLLRRLGLDAEDRRERRRPADAAWASSRASTRAETIKYVPRYDSTLSDMPDGDVVLQTCVSRTRMVLVGLRYAAPARPDP